jgi:hypothetical protein
MDAWRFLAVEWAFSDLFLFAMGDRGDGPVGQGLLFVPMIIVLLATLIGYYSVLGAVTIREFWGRVRS